MELDRGQSVNSLDAVSGKAIPERVVASASVAEVPSNESEWAPLAGMIKVDLDQFFGHQLLPLLNRCHNFQLDGAASAPLALLSSFLEEPQNRALVWLSISEGRFAGIRTLEQKQALIAALLPHITEDFPANFSAISVLVRSTAKSSDKSIYEVLGIAVQNLSLSASQIELLATPFMGASTHNIKHEPHLAPWATLFAEKGGMSLNEKFVREIARRVVKGELSSYDHLLSVVCLSRETGARELLGETVMPPQAEPVVIGAHWTGGDVLACGIVESLRFLPLTMMLGAVTGGPQLLLTSAPYLASLGAGAISTLLKWAGSGTRTELVSVRPEELGEPFFHFAGKVYSKLRDMGDSSPEAGQVLSRIENHPSFSGHLSTWKSAVAGTKP